MRKAKIHIAYLILGLFNWSCIDQVSLGLESGESNLVVFGWVTNEAIPYEIKLSKSNGYSDQSGYPSVSGAEVFVTDQLYNRYDFKELSGTGRYFSDPSDFVGVPGFEYQLTIIDNQNMYISSVEEMPRLGLLEDAFINFIADPKEFKIEDDDENYFITAFINDDVDADNYYRWKVYVNDELRNQPEELVLFDDRFTNGNKFKFDAGNVLFTQKDMATFLHMSLSKGAFDYYKTLKDQTSNSTLSPSTQPGIVIGNITNESNPKELILGYFGASEVSLVEVSN